MEYLPSFNLQLVLLRFDCDLKHSETFRCRTLGVSTDSTWYRAVGWFDICLFVLRPFKVQVILGWSHNFLGINQYPGELAYLAQVDQGHNTVPPEGICISV